MVGVFVAPARLLPPFLLERARSPAIAGSCERAAPILAGTSVLVMRKAAAAFQGIALRQRQARRAPAVVIHRCVLLAVAYGIRHSVVVVEHDMDFVRALNSRVTVLHQGSVLAEGNMDQVQNDPKVVEVYLGE